MTRRAIRPVVILEPDYTGHRMSYCAALTTYATAAGASVTIATSEDALQSDELRLHMGPIAGTVQFVNLGRLADLEEHRYQQRLLRIVARLQEVIPGSEVVLPEGDKFVTPAALSVDRVDRRRLRVLVMRAPQASTDLRTTLMNTTKRLGIVLLARRGATVRVLAPATEVRDDYRVGRWQAVPDPVDVVRSGEPLPPEMELLRRDRGRMWVGVVGHITRRKNLDVIIEAVRRRGVGRTGLVLGGKVAKDEFARCAALLDRFTREGGRLIMINRLLSDAELDACVLAVDTIVLAHSSEGPSGILGKAVALGTPVVAAGALTLQRETRRLAAGVCSSLDASAIAAALDLAHVHRAAPLKMADSSEFARCLLEL